MNAETFEAAVREGISTGRWARLEDWIVEECSFVDSDGTPPAGDTFSDAVLHHILSVLQQHDFLDSEGSFNVLRILEYEWSLLQSSQKEQLPAALWEAFPKFKDPMSWFLVTEILGGYLGTASALDALRRLKNCGNEKARSLIPMGLERMVKQAPDKELAAKAYRELVGMKQDPSEVVRGEVEISMRRIAAQAPDRMV